MGEDEYIRNLEATITRFLEPIRDIPFPLTIRALTGFAVLRFDGDDEDDRVLLDGIRDALLVGGRRARADGIRTRRPNEAGNRIEPYVMTALNEIGLPSTKPTGGRGAGYPDIEINQRGRFTYLECKTYNVASINTTFRAFYFSPPTRVAHDARHLLATFQLEQETRANERVFVPVHWRIYALDDLLVSVKYEFNASNRAMYRPEALLGEGDL